MKHLCRRCLRKFCGCIMVLIGNSLDEHRFLTEKYILLEGVKQMTVRKKEIYNKPLVCTYTDRGENPAGK